MEFKAEKIKSIATRNRLNSILNNEGKMAEFQSRLFDHNGKPKFEMNAEDIKNYYTAGNDFSYNGEIYTLDSILEDGRLQLFSSEKEEFAVVDRNDVFRII